MRCHKRARIHSAEQESCSTLTAGSWCHMERVRNLYLGIKRKMIDLQAPEIVTKPGTEELARTKCEWEGKFRLDSGGQ